jgi:hypothetical protein
MKRTVFKNSSREEDKMTFDSGYKGKTRVVKVSEDFIVELSGQNRITKVVIENPIKSESFRLVRFENNTIELSSSEDYTQLRITQH